MEISGIGKIIETIKSKIDEIKIGYNKTDKSVTVNYTDNSTNFNYSSNIFLPPEFIFECSNEELGKIVKHQTFSNLDAAFKNKPKEMEKYIKMYNPSAVTTAATTITVESFVSEQQILKFGHQFKPMASGDFISQLPKAIDVSTPIQFINVGEDVSLNITDNDKHK